MGVGVGVGVGFRVRVRVRVRVGLEGERRRRKGLVSTAAAGWAMAKKRRKAGTCLGTLRVRDS